MNKRLINTDFLMEKMKEWTIKKGGIYDNKIYYPM